MGKNKQNKTGEKERLENVQIIKTIEINKKERKKKGNVKKEEYEDMEAIKRKWREN